MTLELFPKHPDMDAYRVGGAYQPYAVVAVDKRFSDAELMAEVWRSEHDYERAFHGMRYLCGNWDPNKFSTYERAAVMERFATLPHYDE